MNKKVSIAAVAAALALFNAPAARAQSLAIELEGVPTVLGLGIGGLPDYEGSDEYTWGIAPLFRHQFEGTERYVSLVANELSVNLLNDPAWRLGLIGNYRFGRDDDVEDDVVKRMEKIDDTVMGGVFGEYLWVNPQDKRNRFALHLDWQHDLGNVNEGWTTTVSARYFTPVAKAVDVYLGAKTTYASDDYMQTYFGVSSADAARSGLRRFDADGGFKDVSLTLGGIGYLSKEWALSGGVQYRKLLSDAKDSPVVSDRGDDNQWIFGLGLARLWW